jgi:flagellar biosynthesis/type III secretory pathway protein FliH
MKDLTLHDVTDSEIAAVSEFLYKLRTAETPLRTFDEGYEEGFSEGYSAGYDDRAMEEEGA